MNKLTKEVIKDAIHMDSSDDLKQLALDYALENITDFIDFVTDYEIGLKESEADEENTN